MKLLPLFILILIASARVEAAVVTIDPADHQPAGTPLTNIVAEVTLNDANSSNAINTFSSISSNQESAGFAAGPIWDFQHGVISFYNDNNRLRIDFNVSVTDVRLDFVSNSGNTPVSGTLDVYDSSGNDLGEFVTAPLTGGQSQFMEVSGLSSNAAYAVAKAPDGSFARLTDLQVTTVTPEPGTMVLSMAGLAVGLLRRRRR